ncbi:unnamed protein product [Timema podura]|uniref:Uncharacterized protein n=1 Tax=Timema podura TaxID=61482 RepID=A0ABN7P8H8_TIMPD|nr:unnamed protein product [Timema podura]
MPAFQIKSQTSDCVTLDLLTFDDLELLRSKRTILRNSSCSIQANHIAPNSNRRYLILTYTVEFDRIHYPLPMEYCGPPDPQILQATIRRLESEMGRMQEQLERASGQSRTCLAEKTSHLEKRYPFQEN